MKNIFILLLTIVSLVGCMPASDYTNGRYQYIEGKGLNGYESFYYSMLFLTENVGLLTGNTNIPIPHRKVSDPLYSKTEAMWWRTEDNGHTWQQHVLVENGEFRLLKQNRRLVYGLVSFRLDNRDSSAIFQSNDLGNSWHHKFSLPIDIYDFHFRDSLCGILYGGKGGEPYTFYTTANGGKSWLKYSNNPCLRIVLQQMDDSMVYYTTRNDEGYYSSSCLAGWNYVADKQTFKIPIPHRSVNVFTDSILAVQDDNDMLFIYKLMPRDSLKFLYTFKQPVSFIKNIAGYNNKIYIKFNHSLTYYLFFSHDGGKTWLKREYQGSIHGPQCMLKTMDTLRLWIKSYGDYISSFKN